MATKERLSVSVDPELIAAARAAVEAGHSESLSAWVSGALADRVADERRLRAADAFFTEYEAEHGPILDEESAAAHRHYQERAIVVREGVVVSEPKGYVAPLA